MTPVSSESGKMRRRVQTLWMVVLLAVIAPLSWGDTESSAFHDQALDALSKRTHSWDPGVLAELTQRIGDLAQHAPAEQQAAVLTALEDPRWFGSIDPWLHPLRSKVTILRREHRVAEYLASADAVQASRPRSLAQAETVYQTLRETLVERFPDRSAEVAGMADKSWKELVQTALDDPIGRRFPDVLPDDVYDQLIEDLNKRIDFVIGHEDDLPRAVKLILESVFVSYNGSRFPALERPAELAEAYDALSQAQNEVRKYEHRERDRYFRQKGEEDHFKSELAVLAGGDDVIDRPDFMVPDPGLSQTVLKSPQDPDPVAADSPLTPEIPTAVSHEDRTTSANGGAGLTRKPLLIVAAVFGGLLAASLLALTYVRMRSSRVK